MHVWTHLSPKACNSFIALKSIRRRVQKLARSWTAADSRLRV